MFHSLLRARMHRMTVFLASIFVLLAVVITVYGDPDEQRFTAEKLCIIHEAPKAASKNLGRLQAGESATVLPDAAQNGWIKVRKGGAEGWVFLSRGVVAAGPAAPTPPAPGMHFYYGNIHSHTSQDSSEGDITQSTHDDAFEYAADDALGNLDFLAVTPHNHLVKNRTYGDLRKTVADPKYDRPGKFVPIAGQEFSSIGAGNHLNVFETDAWIDPDVVHNGDFRKLFLEYVPQHKTDLTFAQFNHPYSADFSAQNGKEYGRDDFHGDIAFWVESLDPYVTAIEIISAPDHDDSENRPHFNENPMRVDAWLWALSKGWHLAPSANQDNHRPNWGSASDSRTVAVAPELTRVAICRAFQARRFYASEDSTMEVTFRAGDDWMGSVLPTAQEFTVSVHDAEEPNAQYKLELFKGLVGGMPLTSKSDPEEKVENVRDGEGKTFKAGSVENSFWFVKVTQSKTPDDPNGTEDNAWTAPIWIEESNH
jgi:hypothetical protein